jgi:hypothetical protein
VGASYEGAIRETDGDAVGCRFEPKEITRDFEEIPGGSRIDYNWRGGVDILELLIWLIVVML